MELTIQQILVFMGFLSQIHSLAFSTDFSQ